MLDVSPWYDGREQSYLKHYVLSQYLLRFGPIIGSHWTTINYLDSFAGPWENRHPEYLDTSFAIAVDCLRSARAWVREKFGRDLRLRCAFLEKSRQAFSKLDAYAQSLEDVEARALNTTFEAAVPQLLEFAREPDKAFTFLFVDPKGWTGFAMDVIDPLLKLPDTEVLVNFMTGHIRRFLENEESAESFVRLFGRDIRGVLSGLTGDTREEKALGEYMRSVKRAGRFLYVGSAIVFKPEIETPYFHLIYGTRNNKGVRAFKEVEQNMFEVTRDVRSTVRARRLLEETRQFSMLPSSETHESRALLERRTRYLQIAHDRVQKKLITSRHIRYEIIWRMALAYPLVWESDLRAWLSRWRADGRVAIPTLTGRRRVPDPDVDIIEWV